MSKLRKRSHVLDDIIEEMKRRDIENPVVKIYDEEIEQKTSIEHIKELQRILVQTVIDYVKKNELTDVDAVYFSVDGLPGSIPFGKWCPCTDSAITLNGVGCKIMERQNGEKDELPYNYKIGEYY